MLWSGPQNPSKFGTKSAGHVILCALKTHGDRIAQINDDNGERLTFMDIRKKAIRAAQNLQSLGFAQQIFGFISKTSENIAPIVFAAMAIGSPINGVHEPFDKDHIIETFNMTKPPVIFCDIQYYKVLIKCVSALKYTPVIFTIDNGNNNHSVQNLFKRTGNEKNFKPEEIDGSTHPLLICRTTGSTGTSKGVTLSHAAILDGLNPYDIIKTDDVLLSFSLPSMLSYYLILLSSTINGATRIQTSESWTPELQLRLIEKYRVTFLPIAIQQVILMTKLEHFDQSDVSSLQIVLTGGSKVPFHLQQKLNKHLPNGMVHVAYAMSEMGGLVSFDYPIPSGLDTVGQLLNGMKVKIIDLNGNQCGPNTFGELYVKSNYPFLGYDDEEMNRVALDRYGFYITGDVGYFDDNGNLYIVGRKKECFTYANQLISPTIIDDILTSIPDVKAACAVGIPSSKYGNLPAALIVPNDNCQLTEDDIINVISGKLGDQYKLRGGVYFVPSIPHYGNKVIRYKAQEIATQLFKERRGSW
ncbi:luciferin 4-monooxygenase-like isoform X2 [Contarinia nasturtii]|nr:luciferin 4-monooxygenase-like isoform X2 [Contarinia nasturtii]